MMMTSKLKFRLLFTVFLAFNLFSLLIVPSKGTQLVDIRTGFHHTFSRMVVQFDSKVEFTIIKDSLNNRIIVETLPVAFKYRPGRISIESQDKFFSRVDYERSTQSLRILVYLISVNVRLDYYALERPFRVVVDVYPGPQSSVSPNNIPITTDKNSKLDSALFPANKNLLNEESVTDTPYNSVSSTIMPEEMKMYQRNIYGHIAGQKKSRSQKSNWSDFSAVFNKFDKNQRLLFIVFGLIICLDIVIGSYYFFKRNRKRKHTNHNGQKQELPASQISLPDFKTTFAASLQQQIHQTDGNLIKASHSNLLQNAELSKKIETLIETLNESMICIDPKILEFPNLEEVANDLKKLSPTENIQLELLIGKDGVDFIKKLQLPSQPR